MVNLYFILSNEANSQSVILKKKIFSNFFLKVLFFSVNCEHEILNISLNSAVYHTFKRDDSSKNSS